MREHAVEHVHREVDGPLEVDAHAAQLGVGIAGRHAGGGREVRVQVEHTLGHHLRAVEPDAPDVTQLAEAVRQTGGVVVGLGFCGHAQRRSTEVL